MTKGKKIDRAALDGTIHQVEQTSFDFLIADLDMASTFCRIAYDAGDDFNKRNRNQQNARHAYDTVVRFASDRSFTDAEKQDLSFKMNELRTALEQLGEAFGGAT